MYARVSSAKQTGAGNLERQKQLLEEHCRARGYEVVAVITEQGSGLNEKRKGLAWPFKMACERQMDLKVSAGRIRAGHALYPHRFFGQAIWFAQQGVSPKGAGGHDRCG
ncbi:recombinase family protein [Brockia lithotrophica]|uniref:recombinase family protein n=1 Tax=Brockia lithotrophica TaxID=933949 RepID=UPI000EB0675E